jgi:ferredoxin
MRAQVDKTLCTGCGSCEEICPEVFEVIDDIAVNLLGETTDIPEEYYGTCRDAADSCPVEAIIIEE